MGNWCSGGEDVDSNHNKNPYQKEIKVKDTAKTPNDKPKTNKKVYFKYFAMEDLNCIEQLRKQKFPNIELYTDQALNNECLIFYFIYVNTRMDHDEIPKQVAHFYEATGGNCIFVRCHNESSKTFGDDSIVVKSGYRGKEKILKAKVATDLYTLIQTIKDESALVKELTDIINSF